MILVGEVFGNNCGHLGYILHCSIPGFIMIFNVAPQRFSIQFLQNINASLKDKGWKKITLMAVRCTMIMTIDPRHRCHGDEKAANCWVDSSFCLWTQRGEPPMSIIRHPLKQSIDLPCRYSSEKPLNQGFFFVFFLIFDAQRATSTGRVDCRLT